MIEITNVPPTVKSVFSGKDSVFILFYNNHNIEAELIKTGRSITLINF